MSTRAIYTFKDSSHTVHVYKHCDGYPSGATEAIGNAMPLAWNLPRFEADEFAAAFVAGNKNGGGNLRLIGAEEPDEFATDTEYLYEITQPLPDKGPLHVSAFDAVDGKRGETLFAGAWDSFVTWANKATE